MENVVKYFDTIESSFKRMKWVTVCALGAAVVIALLSVIYAVGYTASKVNNIFVLDSKGGATFASSQEAAVDRRLEAEDHLMRFHELMFNLSPSQQLINNNIERALTMCDRSGYQYYNTLDEQGYYNQLVKDNVTQSLVVDSVFVSVSYPYEAKLYGKMYITRASNIALYAFRSEASMRDVGRSRGNPHGLMIENFSVPVLRHIDTRRRQ